MAALDIFSGGRAMVSLCVGWSKGEFDNLGKRFELRGRKLDESILLLRKLWSADHDEEIRFDGKFFPIESGVFSPGTIQRGGPPIWIGGNSDRALRRALELGDGWHSTSLSLERFRERVQAISNQIPRPDFTLSARLRVSFDASDDRAQLRGSPEAILQELLGYQRAGLEYAVLHFRGGPGEPREQNMQRFMEEIVAKMPERS
jgi:alkanesulfonate monooxygenase SsuD/methylene tetrahydromethanopterin reductase-like flavin-dependent oxidoreductase (luciferase family)